MKIQSTVVLLVLFLVAFGIFALVKLTDQPTAQERAQRRGRIFAQLHNVTADDARRLVLRRGDEEIEIIFDAERERWNIVKPIRALADTSRVRAAVGALVNLQRKRNTEAVAVDTGDRAALAPYGLDEPAAVAELYGRAGDGREWDATLQIGKETPDGFGVNVTAAGDEVVFIVDKSSLESLERGVAELRRRELIGIDEFNAAYVEVQDASGRLVAQKRDGRWQLTEPLSDRADEENLRKLIRDLRAFKVADDADFVDDDATAEELGAYGLIEPELIAEVRKDLAPRSGERAAPTQAPLVEKLLLGKRLEENPEQRYAKLADQSYVVAVPAEALDNIALDPENLRSRELVQLATFQVDFFRIDNPNAASPVVVGKRDEAWKIYQPRRADGDRAAIEQFLRELSGLRIQAFLDDADPAEYGLADDAAIAVSVWEDALNDAAERADGESQAGESADKGAGEPEPTGDPITLLFGKHDAARKRLYAVRPGKPGVVAVDDTVLTTLEHGYLAFRDRKIFDSVSPEAVARIHLVRDGRAFTLVGERGDDATAGAESWHLSEPVDAPAQASAAEDIVGLFSGLRASQLVAEEPEDLAVYGLDPPAYDVTLTLSSGDDASAPEYRLLVGKEVSEAPAQDGSPATQLVYAWQADGALVFAIPAAKVEALREELRQRAVFAFAAGDVTALLLTFGDRRLEVRYVAPEEGGERQWTFAGEAPFELDAGKVQALVDALAGLEATAFEQYEGDLEERYGLDAPALSVEISLGDEVKKVLKVGAANDAGERYAASPEVAGAVFRVADPHVTSFAGGAEYLKAPVKSEARNSKSETNSESQ